jgi:hypothetical protein
MNREKLRKGKSKSISDLKEARKKQGRISFSSHHCDPFTIVCVREWKESSFAFLPL